MENPDWLAEVRVRGTMAGGVPQHRHITPPSGKSLPLGVVQIPYYYPNYHNYLTPLPSI